MASATARHGATAPSSTHLVLIPSYNPGARAVATVQAARAHWNPVWVVVDGSTDGSAEQIAGLARSDPGVQVLYRSRNGGKGAAVLAGLESAQRAGYTHALVMDADGQHPAQCIPTFMRASRDAPQALVLGRPIFDATAPRVRVLGRRLANTCTRLLTLGARIDDTLFGFRVYPIAPLLGEMRRTRSMRRFDFDAEAAVRLSWLGIPVVNLPAPVRYFSPAEGGVSHFRYVRDNLLLSAMYLRLMAAFLVRLPRLLMR